jgi:hypothetical protein
MVRLFLPRPPVHSLEQRPTQELLVDESSYASLDYLDVDRRGFRHAATFLHFHQHGRGAHSAGQWCRMAVLAVLSSGHFVCYYYHGVVPH